MLALERRNEILGKLHTQRRVVVSELSQLYGVSEETIRRDLDKLEKEGLAVKSYGGAVFNEDLNIDLPFNVRKNRNVAGKQSIAELVEPLVRDGQSLFLDASSTAVFIAKAIKHKKNLTVITNSMEILLELADVSGWNIISTGGKMKEQYLMFLGNRAEECIRSFQADCAIVSCKSLDRKWGMMESLDSIGSVKKAMISCARQRILAVDSTKFGQTAFSVGPSLREIDLLVTDCRPDAEWTAYLDSIGVKCLYPDS